MEPADTADPALLDELQAAKFLGGVSQKHLFNLRKRGELPFVRVGARIMYSRQSLQNWIAQREQFREEGL